MDVTQPRVYPAVSHMRSVSLLSLFVAVARSLPSGTIEASDYSRILVVPDIHGDDQMFLKSLYLGLQIVNESEVLSFDAFSVVFEAALSGSPAVNNGPLYSRNDTALIQIGDLIHRGPFGKRCIQILELVETVIGWKTLSLYGNHDIMAGGSLLRAYQNPADDFLPSEIAKDGSLWAALTNRSLLMLRLNPREGIDYSHPRSPATLFVHAGIEMSWISNVLKRSPQSSHNPVVDEHIDHINQGIQFWAQTLLTSQLERVFAARNSPVSTRTLIDGNPVSECEQLEQVLEYFQVARLVVGHTPQTSRKVETLCGGKFIVTDVMMSRWMNFPHSTELMEGRPGAFLMNIGSDGLLTSMFDLSMIEHSITTVEFLLRPVRFAQEAVTTTPAPVVAEAPEAPSNKRQRVGECIATEAL